MALDAASVVFGGSEIQAVADSRHLTDLSIAHEYELTAEFETTSRGSCARSSHYSRRVMTCDSSTPLPGKEENSIVVATASTG